MTDRRELASLIADAVAALGVPFATSGDHEWVVAVPSEMRGEVSVIVGARGQSVRLSAFLMRRPDRNEAEVYGRLLNRNLRSWLWRFALDDDGDVFVVADLPGGQMVQGDLLDRALGALSVLVDESYETTVRASFEVPPETRFGPPPR